jgi:DNA-binding HxlR family transcriptional regulator
MSPKRLRQKGFLHLNHELYDNIGVGQHQRELVYHSQQKIFDALSDGQWHQRKELKNATELYSHTLDKHLRAMVENDLVIRKKDTQIRKYPIPTLYKASQELMDFFQSEMDNERLINEMESENPKEKMTTNTTK